MLRRPLLGMAAAFLFGIWTAAESRYEFAAAAFLLWAASSGVLLWRAEKKAVICVRLSLLLFGGVLGIVRYQSEYDFRESCLSVLPDGGEIVLQGTLSQKEYKNNQFIYHLSAPYYRAGQTGQELCGDTNEVLVYIESGQTDRGKIGQILVIQGTISLWKHAVNEGSFDEAGFYLAQKQDFKVEHAVVTGIYGKADTLSETLFGLKQRLRQVYEVSLENAGVLSAMLLGDKSMLETEVRELYQKAGILHITCISGLHFSVIGMTLYQFLRKRRAGTLAAVVCAGGAILCYGSMTGGSVSSARAIGMFLLCLLAPVFGRTYDSLNGLGAIALLLLWKNPFLYRYAGFLFSCAAVLGAVWIGKCGRERQKMTGLYQGLAIQLTTLPFAAWYYYEIPLYGIFVNLLVLPFLKPLLLFGLAGGFAGLISLPAAKLLLFPCSIILSGYFKICRLAALLPGATLITGRPSAGRMAAYFALLLLWNYLRLCRARAREFQDGTEQAWAKEKQKEAKEKQIAIQEEQTDGGTVRRKMPLVLYPVRNIMCGLFLLLFLFFPQRREFELTILDVGQGDGCFIRTGSGQTLFVDGGSSNISKVGEYRLLPFFKYNGVRKIDYWFVSHTDEDHISGLEELLRMHYPVATLVFSELTRQEEVCLRLQKLAEENNTQLLFLQDRDKLHMGEAVLTAYLPGTATGDKNEDSLVILYEEREFSALFTGDIGTTREQQFLAEVGPEPVDFYKAAHHGSNGSNSRELLQRLTPKAAVISCAKKNGYGHPGVEAVGRLEEAGSSLFYTMEAGQVRIRRWGDHFGVEQYLEPLAIFLFPLR